MQRILSLQSRVHRICMYVGLCSVSVLRAMCVWVSCSSPLNYVCVYICQPGRRPLRSAGTNRLAVPPVKLTAIANQPGFPGCRATDMERSARRRDFSRIVIHLPSAT